MRKVLLGLAALMIISGSATAKDWQVDLAASRLTFTGEQSGEKFSGGFRKFMPVISLDPDNPEGGKISVSIETASIYAGSSDRDGMLPQEEWFDIAHFPEAQFTSAAIRKVSSGKYEADATLIIKGISQKVTLPFSLVQEGDHWRAHGHILLKRNDFSLGMKGFSNENYVKFPVDVVVDIVAK